MVYPVFQSIARWAAWAVIWDYILILQLPSCTSTDFSSGRKYFPELLDTFSNTRERPISSEQHTAVNSHYPDYPGS